MEVHSWSGTPCSRDIPPEFLSTWAWGHPVPCLRPSYQSGWMWFLQSCSCQTSIQLDCWCSWVIVVLCFSCNFDMVVQRGEPYLPTFPSWPEAPQNLFLYRFRYSTFTILVLTVWATVWQMLLSTLIDLLIHFTQQILIESLLYYHALLGIEQWMKQTKYLPP